VLEKLLKVVACFDWISPTASVVQNIANGPSHTFLIPQDCGWSGGQIVNLLRDRGVQTWGHMVVNGHYMITVRQTQAAYASHLLQRAGLALGAGPATQSRKRSAPSPSRGTRGNKAKKKRSDSVGDILREIGDIRL
jgi:hypothetical protein